MLEVKNISKTYPGEALGAVKDVSLNVGANEVLALVGKSGSGKSTLLQIVAGLMKPDSGEVVFQGERLKDPEEQLIAGHEAIKMVFQDFQVKPNMTVEENIKYKLLQFDKIYQSNRTSELLEICHLMAFRNRKPSELSGGQKQRLSIARALADDPALLLMDEPFSNLDPLTKEALLMELIDIVNHEQLSLIFVTHDTKDAMLIADKVAFVSSGKVIQNDTIKNIYEKPENLEIAQFFGRINDVSAATGVDNSYVRAEYTSYKKSEDGIKVNVIRSIYLGNMYLNLTLGDSDRQYFFYSTRDLSSEECQYSLVFDLNDVFSFKN